MGLGEGLNHFFLDKLMYLNVIVYDELFAASPLA